MIVYPIVQMQRSRFFDFGNALYFDAINDLGTIPQAPQNNFASGPWTIAFWEYPPFYGGGSSYRSSISRFVDANNYIVCGWRIQSGSLIFRARIAINGVLYTAANNTSTQRLAYNNWVFVMMGISVDGRFFLNTNLNKNEHSGDAVVGPIPNAPIEINKNVGTVHSTSFVRGEKYMDSLMLFNADVREHQSFLYAAGEGNSPLGIPSCQGFYRFDDPKNTASSSPQFWDSTLYANHGSLLGYNAGDRDFVNHYTLN